MSKATPLLRRTLVELYDDVQRIKIVHTDVDEGRQHKIRWQNAALVVWFDVIKECIKRGKLEELLRVSRLDYPKNRTLRDIQVEETGVLSELEEHLAKIEMDAYKMGVLDLVNCARHHESNDFWKPSSVEQPESNLLIGIIKGSYIQSPQSLAERLTYEFLDIIGESERAVYFPRDPASQRLRPLVIDSKTEDSFERTLDKYLEDLEQNHGASKFSACAHVLEIDVAAAANVLPSMVKTTRKKFQDYSKDKDSVQLLLIVLPYTSEEQSSLLENAIVNQIKSQETLKYYKGLEDLTSEEIVEWFNSNGATYEAAIGEFLDKFMEVALDEKTRNSYRQNKKLSMNIMLRMQAQIFRFMLKEEKQYESPESAQAVST